MENIMLDEICSLSLEMFTIIKENYSMFLSKEKKEFIDNLDIKSFYKIINKESFPPIYYLDGVYYINTFYDQDNLDELVSFLCLRSLCGSINPLKIGLIENEVKKLKEKYNLKATFIYHEKEMEVAEIVSSILLKDLPFNIIFKDTDSDIVDYLVEEKGSRDACFYSKISLLMKEKYQNYKNDYKSFYKDLNYSDIIDNIYDFFSNKVK